MYNKKMNDIFVDSNSTLQFVNEVSGMYTSDYNSGRGGLESGFYTEYVECLQFLYNKNLKNFLEIGSAWGASFHLWSTIISGVKISIDLSINDNHGVAPWPPNLQPEYFDIRLKKWNDSFDNVHQIIGSSFEQNTIQKLDLILKDSKLDFLYIDAEHSYEAVWSDFNNYKKYVNTSGYIGFHDIQLTEFYRMNEFWNEISKDYEHYVFGKENEKIGLIKL